MTNPTRTVADQCATCGRSLFGGYYTLNDRPERYCSDCIAHRPRCSSCGAPVGEPHWRLHDGRVQCATCHSTAVYAPSEACALYDETVASLIDQFGLRVRVQVEFRLVDAPTLAHMMARDGLPSAPEAITLGLYQRYGNLRAIYMLYGLPRLPFRITVAHEYAHAWQDEYCLRLRSEVLREGFAEWVAYRHLIWLGCTRAAQRMLMSDHPYRPMLQHVLELDRRYGTYGVIEYIQQAE